MSFDTRAGTRGGKVPAGRFVRMFNKLAERWLRRRGGRVMGLRVLVLTTTGAKSGAERTTPVGYFPDEDGSWLIVASANGAAGNPGWYYNIGAHPDKVRAEVDGRTVTVAPQQLRGSERETVWKRITATAPRFAQYQEKTDRELPVIRLTSQR
ncbi:nitroreductase/quinone reductase family protein [Amycolatopsis saalfeldensis]|uniref:Deazaflavin-dependent oxidoreductase, nitroreductase family n=1 Tax=Amycolatopsis saalfeldensis TaxID=394193 RepID=A0A1H8RRF4_9PSEU|nr:nitroreductase/quinone reductase family protein [Amycolatopsis saalfeldensis]SEO68926.1 deazaflavin-dependent oxidoreductase, nitroreductase family [Amycolatopsis saalfeldensis]